MTHSEQSTPRAAKEEAAEVARTAAHSGSQVGDAAGHEARRVAHETTQQARDLAREGREQLRDQARQGQRKAADSLHTLADELGEMSARSDGSGLAPEMVRQASERTRDLATWLGDREPGGLLDDVRAFARRKPGVFLAGAAMAGVLAGRLTRGATAAAQDGHGSQDPATEPPQPSSATPPPPVPPPAPPPVPPMPTATPPPPPTPPVPPAPHLPPQPGYPPRPGSYPGR